MALTERGKQVFTNLTEQGRIVANNLQESSFYIIGVSSTPEITGISDLIGAFTITSSGVIELLSVADLAETQTVTASERLRS